MEETLGSSPRLEDIPELIHRIQLRLPVKEAARTSVLSKSWLHAWSTIPTLKFHQAARSLSEEQKTAHFEVVDRTLIRYLRDNIPIKVIYLPIDIQNKKLAENWIHRLATNSCLNRISLSIVLTRTSFTLPDEILSGKNLTKIKVSCFKSRNNFSLLMSTHPVINCLFLQELQLERVCINDDVLADILSNCSLLEVLELWSCKGFNTIKVQNLRRLRKLLIVNSYEQKRLVEVNDVPNLSSFSCRGNPLLLKTHSLGRVTKLSVGNMIMDYTFLDIIKSKFPSLEILSLYMRESVSETFHLTCASLKRLSLVDCPCRLIKVHVNAPKLIYLKIEGKTMPNLVFPAAAISLVKEIKLELCVRDPVETSFFLKMSQAIALSIKCNIKITARINNVIMPPYIDILNLIRKIPSPAMNVQQLLFKTNGDDKGLWDLSPFFYALFSICHPMQVVAEPDAKFKHKNQFCKLMEREFMEKKNGEYLNWPYYSKVFETKPKKEEALSSVDRSSRVSVFKLQTKLALT